MSVDNPFYAEMKRNPICLDIPWHEDQENLESWKQGKTGYPFIDAAMRQLVQEKNNPLKKTQTEFQCKLDLSHR
ncbi:hypothetical protein J437_LFUL000172 [Ladona fulva]|uniref:Cryptochrome-1 n=1 Tax=Ladona fulva TaxID=123851 RepID=A0A8K0P5B2_LADFU|nr:hypothetical protein J437_LFUL000172 [Ladona fulva]